jgi:DNA-binding PucR family transcriptional regulator
MSQAAALGWAVRGGGVVVGVGALPEDPELAVEQLHAGAAHAGLGALASPQDTRLVAILGGEALSGASAALTAFTALASCFGPGPVVVGPVVAGLDAAHLSARPALAGHRASPLRAPLPGPVLASDLLAERVLAGDATAAEALVAKAVTPLAEAGADLVTTVTAYLDEGSSVEATARRLYVHPNTVRYRLRRVADLTGLDPTTAEDAFTLNVAVRVARL